MTIALDFIVILDALSASRSPASGSSKFSMVSSICVDMSTTVGFMSSFTVTESACHSATSCSVLTALNQFSVAELTVFQQIHLLFPCDIICTSNGSSLFHIHGHDNLLQEVCIIVNFGIKPSIVRFVNRAEL